MNTVNKHPMFPNEDTTVKCGRHPYGSCTEAHDNHVAGLIERDYTIDKLRTLVFSMNEELAELRCAVSAFVEVLDISSPQQYGKKRILILKTEGGEESEALLIPREEVDNVLERYRPAKDVG